MASLDEEFIYSTALTFIKGAAAIFKEGFYGKTAVYLKSSSADIVTEYDKKIEEYLISNLRSTFPSHKFIGEETQENSSTWSNDPTWIIDPIDGTTNYVHKFPETCISIAFTVNKEILIGLIYNPITDQLFTAQKGKGAYMNGEKIMVSQRKDLSKAVIYMELSLANRPELTEIMVKEFQKCVTTVQGVRATGSSAMGLCHVASGTMDILQTNGLKCWDVAAGVLIVQEAGGFVFDSSGNKFDLMSKRILAASTEELAKELVSILYDG